ncbi:MAS20-domain-containing protein [Fomitiporia mediterranea MF3/22]|uniref:MAS20-domain-containing protein n=1 Tax=Fomitiporia mediterranea (strain MF3/22) TaxID=694068 RepID=UPI0004408053|nr:MAS20-domain-containing protein [Fomitiporia mediterranea MF3/22]EJD01142.1 MAS20-domain-containing protein [Fomitiporia mediterranea MF3/22]
MSRPSTSSILTITGITILGGFVAYAAYFDYKRRNDPTFRRKIRTQKKKVDKAVAENNQKEKATSSISIPREILLALHEKVNEETLPTNPEEKHMFFMNAVGTGEKLAEQGPQNYLDAAVFFYQALRVYPSPMELIVIYQKTVPEGCLSIVMELYNLDVFLRIQGYYKQFPPQTMQVSVKKIDLDQNKGGQARSHLLVASKSFKAGDVIYKETPIVASLDPDLVASGRHCGHCLREVESDAAIKPESDRLGSIYCSEKCQTQSGTQSQDMLFSDKSPLPAEVAADLPQQSVAERPKTQDALAEFCRQKGTSGLLLVARLVAIQIVAELAKALPQAAHMKEQLPEFSISEQYTVYDHIERLRYIDVTLPDDEYKTLRELLLATLPFLEDVHSDERHAMFRGKVAYNAIGIYFGEGRDDKPTTSELERTRIAAGVSKQIGSGLYLVSSYIGHSCAPSVRPVFSEGTSELHLLAERDIEEGEELTMAYVDVSQRSEETPVEAFTRRRSELTQGWKFACACVKCEEDKKSAGLEGEAEAEAEATADGSKIDYALKAHSLA